MSPGLAQIFSQHLAAYRTQHLLDGRRASVCQHILQCRTEAMGGIELACDSCSHAQPHYFACRDRHCPLCQQQASAQWARAQQQAVLPTHYYHLVFTLPSALNGWVQLHPELIYSSLFAAAWSCLKTFGQDPKRLQGAMGMTAVLHTWGQTLTQHVHLHCLVPGGALTSAGEWNPAKSNYLFPVRALSRHFRGGMVSRLRAMLKSKELDRVTDPKQADELLNSLMECKWVVFSRPCEKATSQVVNYLARYSHRTAISNHRILALDEETVSFRYKDYQDRERQKVMTLSHTEFIRRFLLHVLPKGLMRIRHYGFMANCCRQRKLSEVRRAIAADQARPAPPAEPTGLPGWADKPISCPACTTGKLRIIGEIPRPRPGSG